MTVEAGDIGMKLNRLGTRHAARRVLFGSWAGFPATEPI